MRHALEMLNAFFRIARGFHFISRRFQDIRKPHPNEWFVLDHYDRTSHKLRMLTHAESTSLLLTGSFNRRSLLRVTIDTLYATETSRSLAMTDCPLRVSK
jgi:hypothetical protein